jgi:hypothetical protein
MVRSGSPQKGAADLMQETPTYDVFISYKSDYKPWVETLARNLEAQGLMVWFDDWRKVAGDRVSIALEVGIQQAHAGILIVTPEAAESGWVQREYDTMVSEEHRPRRDGSRFRVIPVLLRPTGSFPFLQTRFAVDFRNPANYERSLIELVHGLRSQPAPPNARLEAPFEAPPPLLEAATVGRAQVRSVFSRMFDSLNDNGIVTLFAQEAMGLGSTDLLLAQARERYSAENVMHIVPMICADAEAAGYFANLGSQLSLGEGLTTNMAIAAQLPRLVRQGRPLVLILTEFENGPTAARRAFASTLRSFYAAHRDEVRIVLRGGEELARLKFEDGEISMLAIAASCYWPELTVVDVTSLFAQRNPGRTLDEGIGHAILELTGGEPRMVGHCIHRLGELGETELPSDESGFRRIAGDVLADCDLAAQLFLPLRRERDKIARVLQSLNQPEIGPFNGPHLDHPALRRLYWRNALCVRQVGVKRTLVWRSDYLRAIGREILMCTL